MTIRTKTMDLIKIEDGEDVDVLRSPTPDRKNALMLTFSFLLKNPALFLWGEALTVRLSDLNLDRHLLRLQKFLEILSCQNFRKLISKRCHLKKVTLVINISWKLISLRIFLLERTWAVSDRELRSDVNISMLFVHSIPEIAIFFFEIFFKSQIHSLLFWNKTFDSNYSSLGVEVSPWPSLGCPRERFFAKILKWHLRKFQIFWVGSKLAQKLSQGISYG